MFYLSIWKLYGFQDKPYSDGLNKGQRSFFHKTKTHKTLLNHFERKDFSYWMLYLTDNLTM